MLDLSQIYGHHFRLLVLIGCLLAAMPAPTRAWAVHGRRTPGFLQDAKKLQGTSTSDAGISAPPSNALPS